MKIIVILGPSGSGKSSLQNCLCNYCGLVPLISTTTRQPRSNETPDIDYHFITNEEFDRLISEQKFIEYSEYSQGRKYGLHVDDVVESFDHDCVVVLTPDGYRNLLKYTENLFHKYDKLITVYSVYITSPLGTRIKRYIDRVGEREFTFDDKNEISSRVERDYGMFLNLERDVNLVIDNDGSKFIEDIAYEVSKEFDLDYDFE